MQGILLVERLILHGVNDVEATYPKQYYQAYHYRNEAHTFSNGHIRPYGCERKAKPQHEMAHRCKSLGVTVAKYYEKCNWRQVEAQWVDEPGRGHKQDSIHQCKDESRIRCDDTGRHFTTPGPLIHRIYIAVEIPVEGHGSASRENHAQQHHAK